MGDFLAVPAVDFFTASVLGLLTMTVVEVLGHVQASSQIGHNVASRSNEVAAGTEVLGLLLPLELELLEDFLVFLLAVGEDEDPVLLLVFAVLLGLELGFCAMGTADFLFTVIPVSKHYNK